MFLPRSALAALFAVDLTSVALAGPGVAASCAYDQSFGLGPITITGAFIPAIPKGAPTAAAYMQIANSGDPDTLTGASSAAAANLTLHQMKQNGSVMEMAAVEGLPLPANGSVSLDPMGYHLMLAGLAQPFIAGQCVEVTLHFAKAGDLPIELNVGRMGSTTPPGVSVNSSGDVDMSSTSMGM